MKKEKEIWDLVNHKKEAYINLANTIFDTPEILYKEFKSVLKHTQILKKESEFDNLMKSSVLS